ncbi:flagellar type III secretion system protein FliR [Paenibacillus psychroresistens]|uniref:Flagellar biosynthetic protein FliR n=1 Tax=Paenibacillus psychroresistens TaxID=1778678 RepID=A0A6B8RKG9_9BACL|nr:flagellar biosynthetic protein FliR [Paenibacillus psychroresistens]QGQ96244.1 flagellar type III secretion system protein FliR [Paenibacillus psychroresistens]
MGVILQYLPNLLLVFCRISSFFVVAPVFSAKNVPMQFKIGLAFFISLLAFSTIDQNAMVFDSVYIVAMMKEIVIGLLLGFVAYLFFTVVQISGSFIDMQMGFSMANIIDPMSGTQSPILGNLKFMLAVLLFITFNGDHYFIHAIVDSYRWVPLSNEAFAHIYNGQVSEFLLISFAKVFALAFQMAAPMIAALFLIDVGLGILARTAPQFNIFVIGMPLKVLVGFILLTLLFPSFLNLFSELFTMMFGAMQKLLELLGS